MPLKGSAFLALWNDIEPERSALHHAASVLPVKAIVTYTTSGSTSLRAACERLPCPF